MMRDVFANPDRRVFWRMTPGWVVLYAAACESVPYTTLSLLLLCAHVASRRMLPRLPSP